MTRLPLIVLGCLIVLLVAASVIWFQRKSPAPPPTATVIFPPHPAPTVFVSQTPAPITTTPLVEPPIHKFKYQYPPTADQQAMIAWQMAQIAKDPAYEWKTPINFDGLVLDENNQPLAGAQVKWITTNAQGNGHGTTVSGGDGRFFIGSTGKGIDVQVTKEGYRTVEANVGFEFADFTQDSYYDHDRDHPAIFHLRKIPDPEPIYIFFGGSRKNSVGDKISIKTRSPGVVLGEQPEGIWIKFVPGPQNGPGSEQYDVVLGTAPGAGGGVSLITDDTDEIAPETGYVTPNDTQMMADFDADRFIHVNAFFKDGVGHYGMIDFGIELGGHKLILRYYLKYNPGGGRSLSAHQGSKYQINKTAY